MKKMFSKFPAALLAFVVAFGIFTALMSPKAGASQYAGGNIGPRANSALIPQTESMYHQPVMTPPQPAPSTRRTRASTPRLP